LHRSEPGSLPPRRSAPAELLRWREPLGFAAVPVVAVLQQGYGERHPIQLLLLDVGMWIVTVCILFLAALLARALLEARLCTSTAREMRAKPVKTPRVGRRPSEPPCTAQQPDGRLRTH
jgi:hypothetical protein